MELFIYMVNSQVKTPKTQNMSIGRGGEDVEKKEDMGELEETTA